MDSGLIWRALPTAGYPASDTLIYISYLNTTTNDTVLITPLAGVLPYVVPPYIDYRVCGYARARRCLGVIEFCDIVRVYIFQFYGMI